MNTATLSTPSRNKHVTAFLLLFIMALSFAFGGTSIAKADLNLSNPFDFVTVTQGPDGGTNVTINETTIGNAGINPVDTVAKVKTICTIIIAICAIAAVTSLVVAGVRIALSGGNDMARSKALKGLAYSLIGAAVIGGSSALFGFAYGFLKNV